MATTNPTSIAPFVTGSKYSSLARVAFRVQSAGAATTAPDFVIPAGACSSPTHASTGLYSFVITGWQQLGELVCATGAVLGTDAENTGLYVNFVSYVKTTGVLTVVVKDSSADPSVAIVVDNGWLMLDLVFAQDIGAEGTTTALA